MSAERPIDTELADTGDVAAAFSTFRDYLVHVYAARTRNPQLAEDIVQGAFVRAWTARERFRAAPGAMLGWLFTLADRTAIDEFRVTAKHHKYDQFDGERGRVETGEFEDEVISRVDAAATGIMEGVAGLSEGRREALLLGVVGEYTQREVADILEEPIGTIKGRQRDAMIELREWLEPSQAAA